MSEQNLPEQPFLSVGEQEQLARDILDVAPKLLRRIVQFPDPQSGVDGSGEFLPGTEEEQVWQKVQELRTTQGQLSLLGVLVDRGRCTMQELADQLAVVPSTATSMVKRLVEQGYIKRSRDDTNWRCVWVEVTDSGRRAVELFRNVRQSSLQRRLQQLDVQDLARLQEAVPVLRHLLEL